MVWGHEELLFRFGLLVVRAEADRGPGVEARFRLRAPDVDGAPAGAARPGGRVGTHLCPPGGSGSGRPSGPPTRGGAPWGGSGAPLGLWRGRNRGSSGLAGPAGRVMGPGGPVKPSSGLMISMERSPAPAPVGSPEVSLGPA